MKQNSNLIEMGDALGWVLSINEENLISSVVHLFGEVAKRNVSLGFEVSKRI